MKRKALPEHDRVAIAAEVVHLLSQVDSAGRRQWTTVSLGQACGGLTHETIRLARTPAGVGPSVREAILAFTGMTIEQLMHRHGVSPAQPSRVSHYINQTPVFSPPFAVMTPSGLASGAASSGLASGVASSGQAPSGMLPVQDRIAIAKTVISALEQDGFLRDSAQHAVSKVVFEQEWSTELDLYRKACVILGGAPKSGGTESMGANDAKPRTRVSKASGRRG